MTVEANHYRRLGVTPAASTEEIRAAYRSLASRLHPDRLIDASPADRALAERRMREINESWRVLQDRDRRRAYDDRRRAAARRPAATARPGTVVPADDDLVDVLPLLTRRQAGVFRHLPWIAIVVVLGGIFVISAYAGHDDEPAPATAPTPGACIDVVAGTSTTVIDCTQGHPFRIIAQVANAADCPKGTEARRLSTDGHFDCLRPV